MSGNIEEPMLEALEKYSFARALRPFSFSVAVITCLVGIISAVQQVAVNWVVATAILLGGVILQAGVNLINDYSDRQHVSPPARQLIRRNWYCGLGCFLLATVIGIYLIVVTGPWLLLLLLTGLAGALGYTLEPVNLKRRGLAVVLVFWLMGVLMVCGSYAILTGHLDWQIFWRSVPVSLISSLLLLANEIRDYETDRSLGDKTLTVRLGLVRSIQLYRLLLALVILVAMLLWLSGMVVGLWWLLALPVVILLWIRPARKQGLESLPPYSGRFFMIFGLLYCFSL